MTNKHQFLLALHKIDDGFTVFGICETTCAEYTQDYDYDGTRKNLELKPKPERFLLEADEFFREYINMQMRRVFEDEEERERIQAQPDAAYLVENAGKIAEIVNKSSVRRYLITSNQIAKLVNKYPPETVQKYLKILYSFNEEQCKKIVNLYIKTQAHETTEN
ncbi:hypothetical protein LQK65_004389 [Vibrio parahaemolyticus]|nr:hypothetical protein [Vibrio parahaemolyticus]